MGAFCRSWGALGRSWDTLGRSWAALGRSWASPRNLLGALGASWSALGVLLGALGALFGRSWALSRRSMLKNKMLDRSRCPKARFSRNTPLACTSSRLCCPQSAPYPKDNRCLFMCVFKTTSPRSKEIQKKTICSRHLPPAERRSREIRTSHFNKKMCFLFF